jgi:putative Ca2+/H+ antiporter (TMEM165/GDT1 family)
LDLLVVGSAFSLIALAEMGDKSQLIAMTLAHRYRPLPVTLGVLGAFLVLNLLAVWVGAALFRLVPQGLVLTAAGLLFLFFAWRSWRDGDEGDGAPQGLATARSVVLTSFGMIFMGELGDKTQVAVVALAAGTGEPWAVFVGATLGLWLVSLLGILLGCTLLTRMPRAAMHRAAAVLFLVFGLLALTEAINGDGDLLLGFPAV